MVVIGCPNCHSKFSLDESRVNPLAKARCSVCSTVFSLADGMSDDDLRDISVRMIAEKNKAGAAGAAKVNIDMPQHPDHPDADNQDAEAAVSSILKDKTTSTLDFSPQGRATRKKGAMGRRLVLLLVVLLLLAGGFYALTRFVDLGSLMGGRFLPFGDKAAETAAPEKAGSGAESDAPPVSDDNIKDLVIHSVRQFYMKNEKIGQLFVIKGKVLNSFKTPKGLIKVEATLFDGEGKPLMEKQVFCGTSVSDFQLQVLSQADLDAALNNKVEILSNNTNILPGSEVPFTVVFSNPPDTVREFGVRVVDAKDPE